MNVEKLLDIINADFFTGIPDSQLKPLINYLMGTYGIDPKHHVLKPPTFALLLMVLPVHK